jgi:hypothetical protein
LFLISSLKDIRVNSDEVALRRDLETTSFKVGCWRGKWALKGIKYPFALFFISAKMLPGKGPEGFLLRSDFSGYSGDAPTSQLWYGGQDIVLPEANRPRNAAGVMYEFRNWHNPNCLYLPVDRIALPGHGDWVTKYPDQCWSPDKNIVFLLEIVYGILQRTEYIGADLPDDALDVPKEYLDWNK